MRIGFTTTSFRQIRDREKIVLIARNCGAQILEWGGDIHKDRGRFLVLNAGSMVFRSQICFVSF